VLELAVEDGLRRNLFSAGQLRWRSSLLVRTPTALATLLVRDQLGRTDSGWELRTARVLTDAGFPEPVRQHEVDGIGRIDLAYPDRRIAFEYDSDAWHSGVARRHRDAHRRNALRFAGWTVIEVTAGLMRTPGRLVDLVGMPVESGEGGQSARGRRSGEARE
jgi:very-short-patch-repair endonuclease